jgi:hypothetical protein
VRKKLHRIWHQNNSADSKMSKATGRRFAFSIFVAPIVFSFTIPPYLALPALADDDASKSAPKADTRLLKFTPDPIPLDPENDQGKVGSSKEAQKDPESTTSDRSSTDADGRRRSIAQNSQSSSSSRSRSGSGDSPSTSLSDFSANPEEAARQLAQSLAKKPSVTSISGTVQVRRPFQIICFARALA